MFNLPSIFFGGLPLPRLLQLDNCLRRFLFVWMILFDLRVCSNTFVDRSVKFQILLTLLVSIFLTLSYKVLPWIVHSNFICMVCNIFVFYPCTDLRCIREYRSCFCFINSTFTACCYQSVLSNRIFGTSWYLVCLANFVFTSLYSFFHLLFHCQGE